MSLVSVNPYVAAKGSAAEAIAAQMAAWGFTSEQHRMHEHLRGTATNLVEGRIDLFMTSRHPRHLEILFAGSAADCTFLTPEIARRMGEAMEIHHLDEEQRNTQLADILARTPYTSAHLIEEALIVHLERVGAEAALIVLREHSLTDMVRRLP